MNLLKITFSEFSKGVRDKVEREGGGGGPPRDFLTLSFLAVLLPVCIIV